jgi:hypothetical protein
MTGMKFDDLVRVSGTRSRQIRYLIAEWFERSPTGVRECIPVPIVDGLTLIIASHRIGSGADVLGTVAKTAAKVRKSFI